MGGTISFNDRPHPGPLLRGEGETFTAFLECDATGLVQAGGMTETVLRFVLSLGSNDCGVQDLRSGDLTAETRRSGSSSKSLVVAA